MSEVKVDYSLYLVTDRELLGERDLVDCIELAIQGGVTLVQLREKSCFYLEVFTVGPKGKKDNLSLFIFL